MSVYEYSYISLPEIHPTVLKENFKIQIDK